MVTKKMENKLIPVFWRKFDQTKNFPEMAGEKIRAWFDFDIRKGEVKVKFALSPVSTEGAIKNMKAEVPHWDFEKLKQETQQNWNKELHKITVEAGNEKEMIISTQLCIILFRSNNL